MVKYLISLYNDPTWLPKMISLFFYKTNYDNQKTKSKILQNCCREEEALQHCRSIFFILRLYQSIRFLSFNHGLQLSLYSKVRNTSSKLIVKRKCTVLIDESSDKEFELQIQKSHNGDYKSTLTFFWIKSFIFYVCIFKYKKNNSTLMINQINSIFIR